MRLRLQYTMRYVENNTADCFNKNTTIGDRTNNKFKNTSNTETINQLKLSFF